MGTKTQTSDRTVIISLTRRIAFLLGVMALILLFAGCAASPPVSTPASQLSRLTPDEIRRNTLESLTVSGFYLI